MAAAVQAKRHAAYLRREADGGAGLYPGLRTRLARAATCEAAAASRLEELVGDEVAAVVLALGSQNLPHPPTLAECDELLDVAQAVVS